MTADDVLKKLKDAPGIIYFSGSLVKDHSVGCMITKEAAQILLERYSGYEVNAKIMSDGTIILG